MNWWQNFLNWLQSLQPKPTPAPVPVPTPTPPVPISKIDPMTGVAEGSVFATPVTGLKRSHREADWVNRLDKWADVFNHKWVVCTGVADPNDHFQKANSYSIPTYDARKADRMLQIRRKDPGAWVGGWNIDFENDEKVPWHPSWKPSDGDDGYVHVVNPDTGEAWGFWNICSPWHSTPYNHPTQAYLYLPNFMAPGGLDPASQLCAGGAFKLRDPNGKDLDFRTHLGNFDQAAGAGWFTPLVTPQEILDGRITHAWHMMVDNTMPGPGPATEQERVSDPDGMGVRWGSAVAPAGKFEKKSYARPDLLIKGLPEGTRFSLAGMTDTDEKAYLDSRNYASPRLRETVRIMIRSLREYGWFIGDSTGSACILQCAGAENPDDLAKWSQLGVTIQNLPNPATILAGLFKPEWIHCYEPPVSTLWDGTTTKWHGKAKSIAYPASVS